MMVLQMQFHETMQWDPLRLPISEVCIRQSNETCYQPLNPQGFASESIVLTIFVPPCPPHPEQSCKAPGTHRKKTCFHSKVGCVSSMFGWQSCNVKKMWYNNWCSYYVCWFGWKFHDVALLQCWSSSYGSACVQCFDGNRSRSTWKHMCTNCHEDRFMMLHFQEFWWQSLYISTNGWIKICFDVCVCLIQKMWTN